MKSYTLALVFLVVLCSLLEVKGGEYTEWMPHHVLNAFLKPTEKKDEKGKNFWDNGHWIEALESRWEDGYHKFRIKISETPKGRGHWWMWYINMDQDSFQRRLLQLGNEGYRLVHVNECYFPNDRKVYHAVWQKIGKPKAKPAVLTPAQTSQDPANPTPLAATDSNAAETSPAAPRIAQKIQELLMDHIATMREQNLVLRQKIDQIEAKPTIDIVAQTSPAPLSQNGEANSPLMAPNVSPTSPVPESLADPSFALLSNQVVDLKEQNISLLKKITKLEAKPNVNP